MKHLKRGHMAFWRYSSGSVAKPFLAAPIVRLCADSYPGRGYIEAEGFGKGYWFKPTFCLPLAEGRALYAKLNALDERRAQLGAAIDAQFVADMKAALPKGVKLD